MDATLEEIHRLRPDFASIGDYATCELLDRADRCLSAWKFEKGWVWLERALDERRRQEPSWPTPDVRYFNS